MPEFRTLLDTYEEMWRPRPSTKSILLEYVGGENTIRFLTGGSVDAYITQSDLTDDENFKRIMELEDSDEKEQKIKEIILDMFKQKFSDCERLFGVRINVEYNFDEVQFKGTSLEDIIQKYEEDKEYQRRLDIGEL